MTTRLWSRKNKLNGRYKSGKDFPITQMWSSFMTWKSVKTKAEKERCTFYASFVQEEHCLTPSK